MQLYQIVTDDSFTAPAEKGAYCFTTDLSKRVLCFWEKLQNKTHSFSDIKIFVVYDNNRKPDANCNA